MRIISGTHKGRPVNPPSNLPVRPTTDFAKEGLFNIIQNHFDLEDVKNVLDLFAGTGSISFEFASRQCHHITSIDLNFKCVEFIKQTSLKFGFSNLKAFRSEAFNFLQLCRTSYDIIFADAPYDMGEKICSIPDIIFEKKILNQGGWLIVEHSRHLDFSKHPYFLQHRNYGNVNFSIFTWK